MSTPSKLISSCSLIALGLAFFCSHLSAEPTSPAAEAGAQAKKFYSFYLGALTQEKDPIDQNHEEMKRFVSARFLARIAKARTIEGGVEADPFLEAQDFDKSWKDHVEIANVKIERERAVVNLRLTGAEIKQSLEVVLVQENGAWKIESVRSR